MKAPAFAYARPTSLAEVFDCLDGGEGVRLLAGGQSLIPALNMRLSAPSLLVDLNRVSGLSGISETKGAVRIGAMTRHRDLAESPVVAARLPLIAKAIPHIAHQAIRNRGTIGGSLVLADPSTELPACCLALDATIVAARRKGERAIAAKDFFLGIYETALAADEVLVAIEFPVPAAGSVSGFDELARRHGDYAMIGLAAQGVRTGGSWTALKLAFFGAGDRPLLAEDAAQTLIAGKGIAAAQATLDGALSPSDDGECSAKTKMHLARVLLGRVIAAMEGGAA
ncbi:MAG: molybdopterin dehydrogenase [Proteobacteria bacterium SG_bin9]|nr:MAG: molybdopterin dehydrogenase [Proteobacteria bacterium SG_bin9]